MGSPTHRLRLAPVDPVDELAPIPISRANELMRPKARDPRFDSIRMAEEAMNKVERDFNRLRLLVEQGGTDPDGPPHQAA